MLPISASAAAARSERGTGTGTGSSAPVRRRAALVLGERGPEPEAAREDLGRVAPGWLVRTGPPGGPDDQVDLLLQPVDGEPGVVGGPAGPERGGVHPQRRQRRAQPVRQVGGHHPFCGDQPVSRSAITLNACPTAASSAGPRTVLRALRSPLPSIAAAAASSRAGRVTRVASRSATMTETPISDQRDSRHDRPGRGHAAGYLGGGNVDLGDREPAAAERDRLQHGVAAGNGGDEGPGRRGRRAQVRGARVLRAADERAAGRPAAAAAVPPGALGVVVR